MKNYFSSIGFIILLFLVDANAAFADANYAKYPFYLGVTGGYGKTTWQGLVPPENKQNVATDVFTPKYVNEGGALWGLFGGYEFLPYFALEAAYLRYPNAKISFDSSSLFSFENNGLTYFTSKTETISLMAKIMMFIPLTDVRAYSSLGVAEVHRSDPINEHWTGSPSFGAGFNYNLTERVMVELGAVYTAGKGQSELNPVEDYFPFLYSVFLQLAYRF